MKATVGDRIMIAAARLDQPVRDAEILEVRGAGGTPPYLVQWSDDGHQTLFFPGPDAHLEHYAHGPQASPAVDDPGPSAPEAQSIAGQDTRRHVQRWQVDITLDEDGDTTTAEAVLHTPAPRALRSRGQSPPASRRPRRP